MSTHEYHKPPRGAERLLRWLLPEDLWHTPMGDFEELYNEIAAERGLRWAQWWYRAQVLKLVPDRLFAKTYWGIIMFKSYLVVAIRNLRKHKSYTLLNISGLAVGMAACVLMLLYVQDERSYDRFHEKADRIYRVGFQGLQGGNWVTGVTNSWAAGELLKTNFSEVEQVVRIQPWRVGVIRYGDQRNQERDVAVVDDTFFEAFTFPLRQGDRASVLAAPNSVVISASAAQRYFGKTDPIGQILDFNDGRFQLTVTGVMDDMPKTSHFHFDFIIAGSTFYDIRLPAFFSNVGWTTQYVYIVLPENYDPATLEAKFPALIDTHFRELYTSSVFRLFLQPLTDIHLTSHTGEELETNGDIAYVYLFSIIALLTLLIACINYMNLATARSSQRAREVGMRKILGAHKKELIKQFLGESVLVTTLALMAALGLAYLFLPALNGFTGKDLSLNLFGNLPLLGLFVGTALLIGVLAGTYPAFFLSAFQPLNVLKGTLGQGNTGLYLRRGLVVTQFGISIVLIIGALMVYNQLDFLKNRNPGYEKEHVVYVPMQTMTRAQYPTLKNELLAHSQIRSVGATSLPMPGILQSSTNYLAEGVDVDPEAPPSMKRVLVDHDFFDMMGMTFAQGRNFSRDFPSDSAAVILNEAAVRELGWEDPIGKWFEGTSGVPAPQRRPVVGVVKDFNFTSLHSPIVPTVFYMDGRWLGFMYMRISGTDVPATLAHIEESYATFVTDRPFTYSFLEDRVHHLYEAEERFLQVSSIFTGLAIGIACLGIFGLVTFMAEVRRKEIGVRKVLGASIGKIVFLLSREFTWLVLAAYVVAVPIAYLAVSGWLQNFAFRTPWSLNTFLLAGSMALLIAWLTISYQALKAALTNPIDTIRYE